MSSFSFFSTGETMILSVGSFLDVFTLVLLCGSTSLRFLSLLTSKSDLTSAIYPATWDSSSISFMGCLFTYNTSSRYSILLSYQNNASDDESPFFVMQHSLFCLLRNIVEHLLDSQTNHPHLILHWLNQATPD